MNVRLSALTDVGMERDHNEDNFLIVQSVIPFTPWDYQHDGFETPDNGLLTLVADGMGGTNAGEIASSIVVKVVENALSELKRIPVSDKDKETFLKNSIHKAKKVIISEAKANPEYSGMGTTVVMAWVINNKYHLAWAGDSRAYILSKGKDIEIVSKDHSLVWELMEKGLLTEEEAETHPDSNIITQSLSDSGAKLKPDSKTVELNDGDKLLLCSDGLNGMVSKTGIANILSQNQNDDACNKLVKEANRNGGTDNITVVLMEVSPFWSGDYSVEEVYEPITEKTIKLTGSDEKDNPSPIKNSDSIDKIESVKDNESVKPKKIGFFKNIWDKITSSSEEEPEIETNIKQKEEPIAESAEDPKLEEEVNKEENIEHKKKSNILEEDTIEKEGNIDKSDDEDLSEKKNSVDDKDKTTQITNENK